MPEKKKTSAPSQTSEQQIRNEAAQEMFQFGMACWENAHATAMQRETEQLPQSVKDGVLLAKQCFKDAAEMGHPEAQFMLFQIHSQENRMTEAMFFLNNAADSGLTKAYVTLAQIYEQAPEHITHTQEEIFEILAKAENASYAPAEGLIINLFNQIRNSDKPNTELLARIEDYWEYKDEQKNTPSLRYGLH